MPYEGEFAGYRSVRRLAEADQVKKLLSRSQSYEPNASKNPITPCEAPKCEAPLPSFVVAIDGSYSEVPVRIGYPGAAVGYVTVASVLVDLARLDEADEYRPVDPQVFRQTEQADTIDAALPGANVATLHHATARSSFRQELYDIFHDTVLDDSDRVRLLDTYVELLNHKPAPSTAECPSDNGGRCEALAQLGEGVTKCSSCSESLFPTDALRIHERFRDTGTNGEAFGLVSQVWERLLIVHFLRCFERQGLLKHVGRLAFFLDGPLAVFGPPAWLSAAISKELMRINSEVRRETGNDLVLIGIEKTGNFVSHFDEIDSTSTPGEARFSPGSFFLPTDAYIKERLTFSDSGKRYGADTYFGRKFFYKARNGARIVASIPFLSDEQDSLDHADHTMHSQFAATCGLLDRLVSSRYPNAVSPLVTAHSHAAIPLNLGAKVLRNLASALMGTRE